MTIVVKYNLISKHVYIYTLVVIYAIMLYSHIRGLQKHFSQRLTFIIAWLDMAAGLMVRNWNFIFIFSKFPNTAPQYLTSPVPTPPLTTTTSLSNSDLGHVPRGEVAVFCLSCLYCRRCVCLGFMFVCFVVALVSNVNVNLTDPAAAPFS